MKQLIIRSFKIMDKWQRKVLLFLLCLLCLSCKGDMSLSGKEDNSNGLEQDILKVIDEFKAIGISAVVIKNNHIVYSHSYGYNPVYSDTTLRVNIPSDGIYWLASVSKTFISTAIMQLVEKKKLKLDDDVNEYLKFTVKNPYYPDVPITVRMLLCHRSSINDNHYEWTLKMMDSKTFKEYNECFNDYRPGTEYDYCNLNYSLLGAIIESVTGLRFDQYIDKNICEPLGFKASFNLTKMDSTRLVRTLTYDKSEQRFKVNLSIFNYKYVEEKLKDYQLGWSTASLSPAGGMRMTALDLAKWTLVHMNYGEYEGVRIISKESELDMWKPQGTVGNYGFAFSQYPSVVIGENLRGMTGGSHGIHSLMFFEPEKKFGFVVICNGCTCGGNGGKMNYEIVRLLYKYLIEEKWL